MPKQLISLKMLERAAYDVQCELALHGFWTQKLYEVECYLVPFSIWEGLFYPIHKGSIHIPAVSLARLRRLAGFPATGLRDVLRHEYMHAVQHCHPSLIKSRRISVPFGRRIESDWQAEYDPELHVSDYACLNGSEHFAETGMFFLKHGGRCPRFWRGTQIEDQFDSIRESGALLSS